MTRCLVEALAETGPGDPVRRGLSAQALASLEYWITRMLFRPDRSLTRVMTPWIGMR